MFQGYDYSAGWEAFGWFLELTPIVLTFTYPVYLTLKVLRNPEKMEGKTMLQSMTSPNQRWYDTDRSDGGGGGGDLKNGAVNGAMSERRRSITSFELTKI